jgi:hypothetical protein
MKRFAILAAAAVALMSAAPAMAQTIIQDKTKTVTVRDTTIVITYDYLNYGNGLGNKIAIVKRVQVTAGPSVGITADSELKASGFQPLVGSETTGIRVVIDRRNGNNTNDENPDNYTVFQNITLN